MRTANALAEREYDGGGSMSGKECLDRFTYAQQRKRWMLKNSDICFLEEEAYNEGLVKDLINNSFREPFLAYEHFATFQRLVAQLADSVATKETDGLSWDEIKEELNNG